MGYLLATKAFIYNLICSNFSCSLYDGKCFCKPQGMYANRKKRKSSAGKRLPLYPVPINSHNVLSRRQFQVQGESNLGGLPLDEVAFLSVDCPWTIPCPYIALAGDSPQWAPSPHLFVLQAFPHSRRLFPGLHCGDPKSKFQNTLSISRFRERGKFGAEEGWWQFSLSLSPPVVNPRSKRQWNYLLKSSASTFIFLLTMI